MSENANKLGQYTLLDKIAQGGMAEVFKAKTRDAKSLERLVVIKRILPHIAANPEYVEMLIDEAKIAVHFTHGNIAQIYDLGRTGEDYFIVMEYVDGKTLSQIFRALNEREQRIPIDILLYCLIELCHGLSYIHRKKGPNGVPLGVVHRDISPQNIILSYSGNVKIIDFGVARADFIEGKTEDGVLKGKFAYMSPEQTKAGPIDYRSDIFSTGILLWELSTGQRLFKRKTHKETVKAVQKAKFDLPSKIRLDLPKEMDVVIKRALAKNARSRYDDAIEMAEDLEKILFKINPEFRPIAAAKFLYKLFGPESDEQDLSHSELTASNSPLSKVPPLPTPIAKKPLEDEATLKEKLSQIEKTPLGKRHWPWKMNTLTSYFVLAFAVFILGSFYAFLTHWSGTNAHLVFKNRGSGMTVMLDGHILPKDSGNEIPITPNDDHLLDVQQEKFISKTLHLNLKPGEHMTVDLALEKIPDSGDLVIVTNPQGAEIWLNGTLQSQKTPATLKNLKANEPFVLELRLTHYKSVTKNIEILAGNETKIFQPLEFQYAKLLVTSTPPEALVFIDGKEVGITPYFDDHILPGKNHAVTVSADGYSPETKTLELAADTQELHFVLKARQP